MSLHFKNCILAVIIIAGPFNQVAVADTNSPPAATNNTSTAPARSPGGANNAANEADHKQMMDLLHIDSIRRGRVGGNKQSPFYAHYDEAMANPYPVLPDPLVLKDGR